MCFLLYVLCTVYRRHTNAVFLDNDMLEAVGGAFVMHHGTNKTCLGCQLHLILATSWLFMWHMLEFSFHSKAEHPSG